MSAENNPYLTDASGHEHTLGARTTIGRAVENEVVVVSKRASREHARIHRDGRKTLLEDLGSTNGTYLNGERVLGTLPLRDGDQIAIGEVHFTFHDPDVTTSETPFPDIEVDPTAGVVRVDRRAITLSPKEFILLAYLYERRGQVCSKDDIGRTVWSEYQEGIFDYQIENLVRRLRTKIEKDPNLPQLLITIRGLGYKLMAA